MGVCLCIYVCLGVCMLELCCETDAEQNPVWGNGSSFPGPGKHREMTCGGGEALSRQCCCVQKNMNLGFPSGTYNERVLQRVGIFRIRLKNRS